MNMNLYAAWVGILIGCIAGAIPGLFFHRETWLGGYASWRRRLIRLGHISFFGLGLINLSFALTVRSLGLQESTVVFSSVLLLCGAVLMPTVCYLSAWKSGFRNLFFLPAGSMILGLSTFVWRIFSI